MNGLMRRLGIVGAGLGLAGILISGLGSGCIGEVMQGVAPLSKSYRAGVIFDSLGRGVSSYEGRRTSIDSASAGAGRSNVVIVNGRENSYQPRASEPARASSLSSGEMQYYKGKLSDGSDYEGGWRNGMPEGIGTDTERNTRGLDEITWKGEFRGGAPNGQCELTMKKDGKTERYVGEVKMGVPEGEGENVMINGTILKGTFSGGNIKRGTMNVPDGRLMEGEFKLNSSTNEISLYTGILTQTLPSGEKKVYIVKEGAVQ